MTAQAGEAGERCFVDLHCHTSFSFDSLSRPADVVAAGVRRGLTHLAITDHDRIDGALLAREAAPPGLSVIVGEEIRSADGDVIGLFLTGAVPPGLSALETVDAIHAQGGVAGIPHPFDHLRRSGIESRRGVQMMEVLAPALDYVEAFNARVPFGSANERAGEFARDHGLPGVAVSDAHTVMEVGIAYTILPGRVDDADSLRSALSAVAGTDLVRQRASLVVRAFMPVAKAVQRLRGNRRVPPVGTGR